MDADVETELDARTRVLDASNLLPFRLAVEILPWPATSVPPALSLDDAREPSSCLARPHGASVAAP